MNSHSDFSQNGALERLRPFLEENKHFGGNRYEIIKWVKEKPQSTNGLTLKNSVWRVTNGPNDDWPLALCDYNTVALNDLEMSDVIHENYVGESVRVYFDPKHQWYFLSEQQNDEIVIFRNTDSRGMQIPCESEFSLFRQFLHADSGKSACTWRFKTRPRIHQR
jgi:hypothetical protein